jgi:5-methylcytosine-specific restriction endonuclease McrA
MGAPIAHKILALDSAGSPNRWIDVERAIYYYAKGLVAWSMGSRDVVYHGGIDNTGVRSSITANSIIAVKGKDFMVKNYGRPPLLSKEMLLGRDRCTCAYCGIKHKPGLMEMEHIIPRSRWVSMRGGKIGDADNWMNVVISCKTCNDRKLNKTPEEAGMPLLYLPYVPNRHEAFILKNRSILADQMEFLLLGVPKHSRLL